MLCYYCGKEVKMKQELMQSYEEYNPNIALLKSRIEFLETCLALVLRQVPNEIRQQVIKILNEVKT